MSTLSTSAVAAPPQHLNVERTAIVSSFDKVLESKAVTASADAVVSFDRVGVTSTKKKDVEEAPKPAEVVVQESTPAPAPQPATATAVAPQPVQPATAPVAAPAVAEAPVAASSGKQAIADAALAQLGVQQDCTMLVTNALRAVGINYHGWPAGYMSLGTTVPGSQAQPGDLIYYDNAGAGMPHIAVYIGNGMAVHGGFNGGNTAIAPAELGSGGVYIRVA